MTSVNALESVELAAAKATAGSLPEPQQTRPVRELGPQPMQGAIEPDVPPEAPEPKSLPLIRIVMPVVMLVAVVGMVAMMFVSGMARNPMTFMFPMMMVVSMLGMFAGGGSGSTDIGPARRDYQRHLASIRRAIVQASTSQRLAAVYNNPASIDLWQLAREGRAFERRPLDDDFLTLRVGIGTQRPITPVTPPEIPAPEKLDPVSAVALRQVIRQARVVKDLPVSIDLKSFPVVAITSDGSDASDTNCAADALARSIVAQCATFHHPEDVAIVYAGADVNATRGEKDGESKEHSEWGWIKWLPHNWDMSRHDAAGPWRLSGRCIAQAISEIEKMAEAPRAVVLVVDSADEPDESDIQALADFVAGAEENRARLDENSEDAIAGYGVCHVVVIAPNVDPDHVLYSAAVSVGLSFTVRHGRILAQTSTGVEDIAEADALGLESTEALARILSGLGRPSIRQVEKTEDDNSVLRELTLVPPQKKREFPVRLGRDRLRIPVGAKEDGSSIYLDFKESAEGGVGPHGLCVGATGSGKSEFLKGTVLGLAATHSPEQLNFVLVDFKGGATFLGLDSLPHVSAVITNLSDELVLVDRMQDALRGEMTRRQELLRASGNFPGVAEYEQARRNGRTDLAPLPALLIVVDEFSELLAARPEFSELFVAVGRLGRSLHMHLLLASQRLEEGRLRGLESHLSYRVGLKTFSPAESRSVLGVPDAYHLPSIPGSGYLKTDSGEPVRFRAAYVSGAISDAETSTSTALQGESQCSVELFTTHSDNRPSSTRDVLSYSELLDGARSHGESAATAGTGGPEQSVLQATVDSMRHLPRSAHQVWLPPLPQRISRDGLTRLFDQQKRDATHHDSVGHLTATIGLVDKPLLQRQEQLVVDLSGTGGHVAIVGAPRSGKTTAIRTLLLALAENSSAKRVHFYLVDFGAGGLADLNDLPHVSAVAHRGELERIRRVIGFLRAEVSRREQQFRRHGWHSVEAARREGIADVLLCIDGWPAFRNEHLTLSEDVQALVADGLAVGIHVVLTAHRWTELRPAIRDLMGTRIELRQAEAIDSVVDRKAAALVPESPGRGLSMEGYAFLLAETSPDDTAAAATAYRSRVDDSTEAAPKLQLLPKKFSYVELLEKAAAHSAVDSSDESDVSEDSVVTMSAAASRRSTAVPLGLDETGLSLVSLDTEKERHLLIFGAAGSGRTSVLHTTIASMSSSISQTKFVVIDYRRGLLEAVPESLLAGYAGSAAVAAPLVQELAATLAERLPHPDIKPAQLKARDWWQGPEIVLVIDDYELVTGGRTNPLLPLAELIPHAADIGLRVVIARRISGAHRSLHDQVLGAVKDQGATAFLMSGSKEDGPLFGVPVSAQPPGRGNWIAHGKAAQIVQIALPPVEANESAS